jgi:hypothetical protein
MNSSEAARELGVHASYIGEWRNGLRPTRLQERTRRKLEAYLAAARPAGDRSQFYDGVLFAAEAMSATVTRLLAEARAGLSARSVTPTAGEVAVGLEALGAAGALQPPEQGKPPRKAQSREA